MPEIDREFGSLYFRVSGSGSGAVMLLHDFFGTHASWTGLQDALSRYYLVIAPDLRGHGRSIAASGDMSVSSMADDAVAILDQMELERAHLIGCSHGAVIALHAAREMADRIDSIVATSVPDLNERSVIEYGHRFVTDVFPRLESDLDLVHGRARSGYARNVLLKHFVENLNDPPADHRDAIVRASEIQCPVLILGGDSDPVMTPAQALRLARQIRASHLGILPDTGHLAHRDSPALYTEAVLDHLSRHRKQRSLSRC